MKIRSLLALLPFLLVAADPRPRLVQLQLEQKDASALDHLEQMAALEPQQAPIWGLDYLRGHLLERLDRPAEAAAAFNSALMVSPSLARHSILRLAENRYRS